MYFDEDVYDKIYGDLAETGMVKWPVMPIEQELIAMFGGMWDDLYDPVINITEYV
jgi:hypothetical protein